MERSKKAFRNVLTGLSNKIVLMLLAFTTRTLFIRVLGAEYTGVSSLFTNILSVLSLAELGVGNVLMFYLYAALKDNDTDRICKIVYEFKKIYNIIILIVIGIGVSLIPFLKYIVKSNLSDSNLVAYYLLYLLNSVASYFVVYRTMVVTADQKIYISNIVSSVMAVLMYGAQIVYLLVWHEFVGYLLIQVGFTVFTNVILNFLVKRLYPYLRSIPKYKDRILDRKEMLKNIKATFLFKASDTVLDQTDSIIISILFGTVLVGYYYNYYILITYIVQIAGIVANGLLASFGNLNAEGDMNKSYKMFRVALLGFAIMGTFCTTCYACVIQDFIPMWVGSQYVMNYRLVLSILAVFYLRMATNTMWMYRSSMGLFKEVQYINVISAFVNIVFSIILGKLFGIPGVIAATALSRLLTSFWYEGKVVFERFKKPVWIYYYQQLKYFIVCLIVVSLSYYLGTMLPFKGIIQIVLKIFIAGLVTGTVEYIVYRQTEEFQVMMASIKRIMRL